MTDSKKQGKGKWPANKQKTNLAGGQLGQAKQRELVALVANQVVVLGIGKGERQHALLLEVGLVDAGKALDDDGAAAKVAGLQRGVLAAAALAVVFLTDNHPRDALGLVGASHVCRVRGK